MTKSLLSIGHGYSAQALARVLLPHGWQITGTTRTAQKADELVHTGINAVVWPGTDLAPYLTKASHLLISAAPDGEGDPFLKAFTQDASHLQWIGYLSTTGVYGDHGGAWVDEGTPTAPTTRRGQHRVLAEQQWLDSGLPVHIFRLAGIYGPGRGPFSKLRSGTARRIVKAGQKFSRIHVDDIARVVAASIGQPNPGAIYNVCDDDPAPPQDVIAHAAEILDLPVPMAEAFETAEMSPMARSFYSENKRVKNDKIKLELGVTLKYPDYRTGLNDLARNAGT